MVERISSMLEALGSVPSTGKKGRQAGGLAHLLSPRDLHTWGTLSFTLTSISPAPQFSSSAHSYSLMRLGLNTVASSRNMPLNNNAPCLPPGLPLHWAAPRLPQQTASSTKPGSAEPMRGRHGHIAKAQMDEQAKNTNPGSDTELCQLTFTIKIFSVNYS